MSPPVWGATVCSSPWGSPAAPPLLSGWISLKGVLAAANPFMQWEKNTWIFTTRLVVLPPPPSCLLPWLPPPCRWWQLPALPLLTHLSQRLSPFPLGAALAFSTQNQILSHCWQNSSELFPHLSGTPVSPPLLTVLFYYTPDPFTSPGLAPEPAVPLPCHPVPAFLAPSPQHCIPINMPALDHVARLSFFCTVLLTCFQPDAKLIQPTERAALTLLDFKWRIYTKSAQQHRNNSHVVQRYPRQL